MKDNLRIWPMKALAALALACGLFPMPVLLGRWLFPGHSLLWWFPFALAYVWGAAGYLLPKKFRVIWTVSGCVCAGGLLGVLAGVQSIPLALPCIVLLILLPPAWARPVWEEWPAGFWIIGVALLVAIYAVEQFDKDRRREEGLPPKKYHDVTDQDVTTVYTIRHQGSDLFGHKK